MHSFEFQHDAENHYRKLIIDLTMRIFNDDDNNDTDLQVFIRTKQSPGI